jgi:uncharacterized protein YjiS (DUF1127 family)
METASNLPPGNGLASVGHHILHARELRAQAVGRGLGRLAALALYPVRYLARQLKERLRRRATYRELAALDAHALADIGITPGDFDAIVNGTYEQDGTRINRRAAAGARLQPAPENVTWLHRPQPGIRHPVVEASDASSARGA